MSLGLISTIITTYKRPDTLERAIESVLNQTYSEVEVIVVDDNDENTIFRDETISLMSKYKNDPRIIYLKHKNNLNGAAARNTGLKKCNGDFITFLDDDDFFHPKRFEILIDILANSSQDYGLIFSGFQYYRNGKVISKGKTTHTTFAVSDIMYSKFISGSGSNFIMKRSVIDTVKKFDTDFERHQDVELLVRAADYYKFIVVDDILLNIQVDSSIQNKISINRMIETKKQFIDKFEYIIKKYNLDYSRVELTSLKGIVYLIFYYRQEKEFKDCIKKYKSLLSFLGKINFLFWAINIRFKNFIKKLIQYDN